VARVVSGEIGTRQSAEQPDAHQEHLLQNEHERSRKHIGGIAGLGIEYWYRGQRHGIRRDDGDRRIDADGDQASGFDFGTDRARHSADSSRYALIDQKITGVGIERDRRRPAVHEVALEILRDHQDAIDPARKASRSALARSGNTSVIATSGVASTRRAKSRLLWVPSRSTTAIGTLRKASFEIGLGIEQGIERGAQDEHGKRRLDRKDATNFIPKSIAKAAHDGTSASGCGALRSSIR
jgi:hypothetical protein